MHLDAAQLVCPRRGLLTRWSQTESSSSGCLCCYGAKGSHVFTACYASRLIALAAKKGPSVQHTLDPHTVHLLCLSAGVAGHIAS